MHNISLTVNNNAYEHLMYILSNLKDDIKVVKDELYNEDFKIDEDYCVEVANQIKLGNTSDFKPIDDVDTHIKELINEIS